MAKCITSKIINFYWNTDDKSIFGTGGLRQLHSGYNDNPVLAANILLLLNFQLLPMVSEKSSKVNVNLKGFFYTPVKK